MSTRTVIELFVTSPLFEAHRRASSLQGGNESNDPVIPS